MENLPTRYKAKNKTSKPSSAKPKSAKKRKSEGPSCSMFLAEIAKKLALKKKMEQEAPKNVVQTIIESVANALPIKLSKKSPPKIPSPTNIETLQSYAPELLPNDLITIDTAGIANERNLEETALNFDEVEMSSQKAELLKLPKMPVNDSEVFRLATQRAKKPTQDEAINTCPENDVATEIAKHVDTLKKISLIAEEFNQKTAKNLKEIVHSVQEELVTKLEEFQTEQRIMGQKMNNVPNESAETEET